MSEMMGKMAGEETEEKLQRLTDRLAKRFSKQSSAPDLLPAVDCDIKALTQQVVPDAEPLPLGKRSDMYNQAYYLSRTLAGRSDIELLHALTISYLRRDTPHTSKAWLLFRRLWAEESDFLCRTLTVRWIISALQTFYDHSPYGSERAAGGIGFMYGNLIKIYETEYNSVKSDVAPRLSKYKNNSVPTMYGFTPGDDILININVLALDAAIKGDLAGPPLKRLLAVIADSNTIFQRTDSLRTYDEFAGHPTFTLSFDGRV